MKKTFLILTITIISISCGNKRDLNDLKLHSDKIEDVKQKFGQADSIEKVVILGNSSESWYYKKDSFSLVFVNDILTKVNTPKTEMVERIKMEMKAKALMDSLFNSASKQMKQEDEAKRIMDSLFNAASQSIK